MPSNPTHSVPHLDFSMALDADERDALKEAQIRVVNRVNLIRQASGKTVYRFDESGGASGDLGFYAGVLPLAGSRILLSRKLVSFSGNKEHRRIIAPALVRFEVFRYRTNYVHVYITLHAENRHQLLFRARNGELLKEDHVEFPPESGLENKVLPSFLIPGFRAALAGARCRSCQCMSHFLDVAPVKLPAGVLAALHVESGKKTETTTKEGN